MIRKIFLDVQINNSTNEIFSIAALGCGRSFTPKKQFFSIIRSDSIDTISDEELKFYNIKREKLKEARDQKTVAEAFCKNFFSEVPEQDQWYIVWDVENFKKFEALINSYGYTLPKYRIIDFQDIMSFIDLESKGKNDLEYYLQKTSFSYNKVSMHYSKYLIDIMSDFYMHVRARMHNDVNFCDVVTSNDSIIFHKLSCGHTHKIKESNLVRISPRKILDGFKPCAHCKNDIAWRTELFGSLNLNIEEKKNDFRVIKGIKIGQAKKDLQFPDKEIDVETIKKICSHFKFQYQIADNSISINTDKASWIIRYENNTVEALLHENWDLRPNRTYGLRKAQNKNDSYKYGYHDQKVNLTSLVDVCEYIYKHDKNPNSYRRNTKARLTALFELIEKAG